MHYSAIGILAVMILLIENHDILLNRHGALELPAWKVYRRFLLAVLVYYVTDIVWGIAEASKMPLTLFIDTSVYFIAMAAGILFWTQYAVSYLEEDTAFGRFLINAGRVFAGLVALATVVNTIAPVLFTVDADSVYSARVTRYVILSSQILLFVLVSIYTFSSIIRRNATGKKRNRCRTLGLFGLIMALFLYIQVWYPYLPLYSAAYMVGTCVLHTFVVWDEKEEYRFKAQEGEKIAALKQSLTSLLDNMPGMTFTKDAETGVYLACNQAFADYSHKESPEGVMGLSAEQIFDAETAAHFTEDDKIALSMDAPYIYFEDVPDAAGNRRQLQTTKLKYIDSAGRLCVLGMCQDVTDMVRVQRENATTKDAYEKARGTGIIFTHIAQALARGYTDLYYVNLDTEEYIEYHSDDESGLLAEARRGWHFFEECKIEARKLVYPDDQEAFIKALNRRNLVSALERNKTFVMTYRLKTESGGTYVSLRVSRMEDDERYIVLGVTNVDEQMKQRRAAERIREEKIAYGRLSALAGDFLCIYVVVPETGRYREFSATADFDTFAHSREGADFFSDTVRQGREVIYPEDVNRFLSAFSKENVMEEIRRNGIFTLSYRLMMEGKPRYVQLKAAMVEEKEGKRLVVGVSDIDAQVLQEEKYVRHLAEARIEAKIDALTGVKNRHSYLDAEERLNVQIAEGRAPEFAVSILDVNDLKKINDTEGHAVGDQYIRDACRIICNIFKHSPVFRVGGDEFAVISQGSDYERIEELTATVRRQNEEARRTGGIVIACGMAKYENDDSVAPVFERADQNMYENKAWLKEDR